MYALFGKYAGLFATIAFVAAWLVMFGPRRTQGTAGDDRETGYLVPAAVLVGALATAGSLLPLWRAMRGGLLASALIVVLFAAACAGLGLFRGPRKKGTLITNVGLFAFITVPILVTFSQIAYEMWNRKADPGAVRESAESSLAHIHSLFIILCIVLSVVLMYRGAKGMTMLPAVASAVFLVCVSAAFFWTIPRAGEAIFRWMFIIPVFLLAVLAFLITLAVTLVRRLSQLMAKNETAQESKEHKETDSD